MSSRNGNGNDKRPEVSTSTIQLSQTCHQFEFGEILLATDRFSDSLVIGRGGFGKVYKGNLIIGTTNHVVAMKRLDLMSNQGAIEFWAEVEMLSKLRHSHLVSLIGYCNYEKETKKEMILVYEYMPNGTLGDHLHKLKTPLSWVQLLKICIGAARGLDYLHTGTGLELGVIHRDVKSSNILLHKSWAAKISDFGLARIGPTNQPSTYVNTLVKGTFGYIDPNYFATGKLTRKSDVYAFGVVLFEVLCQKRPLDRCFECGLATWVQEAIKEGKLKQIVHPGIKAQISSKCLKGFARIAERCLDNNPNRRPTMSEIVFTLESLLAKCVISLEQKTNNGLQTSSKTIFERVFDVFPSSSPREESNPLGEDNSDSEESSYYVEDSSQIHLGGTIFNFGINTKALVFLRYDNALLGLEIIGKGGCGEVFKSDLNTVGRDKTVAIKRIIKPSIDTRKESELFNKKIMQIKSEIQTVGVGLIRHRNILPLLAHVSRPTCHYLVYEYMENGSLQDILQQVQDGRRELDWLARYNIAIGIANALEYLHFNLTPRIVHTDLKAANILLDADMVVRISGFGHSKEITSPDVVGTLGYIPPEYHQTIIIYEKCDIYSFGVLLGVLLLPRNVPWAPSMVNRMRNIITLHDLREAIDPSLLGNKYEEQMLLVLKIACLCTLDNPKERPTSIDCRHMLGGIRH